jgi:Protein of unknown function (DUF2442)
MNPRVASVCALPGLKLQLDFQDGRRATFDVSPYVDYPVFQQLKDPEYFSRAKVDHGTVQWPGGIDFDPDTLYLESQNS